MKEIIKRTFEPETYSISHSGIYTYINYHPIKGSTIVSSYMIPNGGGERIEIIDGVCNVIVSAKEYFESLGFNQIHHIIETDEDTIEVYCESIIPNNSTPHIKKVYQTLTYLDDGEAVNYVCIVINHI